jgi:hypothetical protein
MIFILFLLPLLILLFSFLVLYNAGRNLKEKLTIFLYNSENTGKGSSNLIIILRISFWVSLIICLWMIITIIRHKG